jgi:cytochrome c oxidase subunit 3
MSGAHAQQHDYHLVNPSPWPLVGSASAFVMALGLLNWLHDMFLGGGPILFLIGLLGVLYTMFGWWSDVIKEAHEGHHTPVVQIHYRYGMLLFIASEVMFFVAWFWAFFGAALYPEAGGHAITLAGGEHLTGDIALNADYLEGVVMERGQIARNYFTGAQWPPAGIDVLDPWHYPLINTVILLTSGTTVTWAHHALIHGDRQGLKWGLVLTILLGLVFTSIQAYEYSVAPFEFSGNIYGATFFMATGFHGFHVIVGTIFLIVCLIRALRGDFTPQQHFGFEAAAWYWHFVDVVWLFLFASIYVWGSWGVTPAH